MCYLVSEHGIEILVWYKKFFFLGRMLFSYKKKLASLFYVGFLFAREEYVLPLMFHERRWDVNASPTVGDIADPLQPSL